MTWGRYCLLVAQYTHLIDTKKPLALGRRQRPALLGWFVGHGLMRMRMCPADVLEVEVRAVQGRPSVSECARDGVNSRC